MISREAVKPGDRREARGSMSVHACMHTTRAGVAILVRVLFGFFLDRIRKSLSSETNIKV